LSNKGGRVTKNMSISTVFITGIAGSGGSYLAEYICKNLPQVKIHGLAHARSKLDNLKFIKEKVVVHQADLLDFDAVLAVLDTVRPDAIFHLAA